jgi:hypothetical protein
LRRISRPKKYLRRGRRHQRCHAPNERRGHKDKIPVAECFRKAADFGTGDWFPSMKRRSPHLEAKRSGHLSVKSPDH